MRAGVGIRNTPDGGGGLISPYAPHPTTPHTDSQLCGQHALNALLQGPWFSAPDLAEIGAALDKQERDLMLAAGADTEDAIRFVAEDSGWVGVMYDF